MPRCLLFVLFSLAALTTPADVQTQPPARRSSRRPPPGIEVPDAVRKELTEQLVPLEKAIEGLVQSKDPKVQCLLPDVQIFHKAVHDGLKYDEMYSYDRDNKSPLPLAKQMIQQGLERAKQLKEGKPLWTSQTGLVPR